MADRVIGALADLQHGVVARWQLLVEGLSSRQITTRIADGRLRPIHRGVYLVGHRAAAPLAMEQAAILAFRSRAVLSHRTAADVHGLLPWPRAGEVWVTSMRHQGDRPGIRLHRAALDPCDVTTKEGLPITTPARAILECAAVLPMGEDERLETMCAEAHARGTARLPALIDQIDRNPGRRGVARLARILDRPGGPALTKRELERRLLRIVRASDLPAPETNVVVCGREVDMVWRGHRVVVEADSYRFHSHSRPWARDIGKSNELQLQGYLVLRFTWRDVTDRPSWVIAEIRRALGSRRPTDAESR